jgi:LysM repeat protein
LITNAPDTRSAGKTPKSELLVNRCLDRIAKETNLAYYDVNRAMGGWGSQALWQANDLFLKDQLHFNKKGATLIGSLISHALFVACSIGIEEQDLLMQEINASFPKKNSAPIRLEPKPVDRIYIVKAGDSLSAIAKNLGTSVENLCKLNGISDPNSLKLGQKIRY